MAEPVRYTNISQQDIHLHPVGASRRERIIVEPGETSPPVVLSDRDILYLTQIRPFLVPETPVAVDVPVPEVPAVEVPVVSAGQPSVEEVQQPKAQPAIPPSRTPAVSPTKKG